MMIQAVLGNPYHPEYGVATIPFPIPHDQYAHCMELLEALEIGDAVIDFGTHILVARGEEHQLSFYELELLRYLAERAGQAVSRDEILLKIWGLEGSPKNRTVDNFIVKLRKKIEPSPDKPVHILTVYGFGYKLVIDRISGQDDLTTAT